MKKRSLGIGLLLTGFALTLGAFLIPSSKVEESLGYSAASLPTTIDLNPTAESEVRSYYANANGKQGNELLKKLKDILKSGQKYYSYDSGDTIWKMYEITDRDWVKSPASSISGFNSGTNTITGYSYNSTDPYIHALYINRDVNNQTKAWANHNQDQWGINREHVWPKAEGFDTSAAGGARGDPMHLMAGNGYANNIHSNYYYGYVKTSSSYTDCGSKYSNQSGNLRGTSKTLNTGTVFEPQDCDKGDIARAIFYMVARYNYLSGSDSDGINSNNPNLKLTQSLSDWASSGYTSTTSNPGKMGIMTDLLAWHHADPVDDYEIKRNDLLYTNFTNNRNPFIDFPDWADYIWGSVNYNGSTYISNDTTPTGSASPSTDTFHAFSGGSSDPVAVTGVSLNKNTETIEVGDSEVLTATISPSNATNRSISWTSSNSNVATVSSSGRVEAVAEGSATITVTTSDGGFTATCAITVTAASGGGGSDEPFNDTLCAKGFSGRTETGYTAQGDDYSGKANITDNSGCTYVMQMFNGSNGQVKGNGSGAGNFSLRNSKAYSGYYVSAVSLTVKTGTIDGSTNGRSVAYFGTSAYGNPNSSAPTGSYVSASPASSGQTTLTWSNNDTDCNYFLLYNLKTSGSAYSAGSENAIVVTWTPVPATTKALDSITLDTSDAPTTFNVGDTFSYEGLSVTANYDDGTDDIVTPTSVSTPSLSSAGQKTVTVSYTEGGVTKTATYTITVNAVTLESIEVSDAKTAYYVGDTFVKPTVTATYSNGSTSDVTNDAIFSGYNLSNTGNQTVSVSYTNGTTVNTSYSITVTALAVTSIEISGYTTTFKVGDTFSYGGTVIAHYNNGSTADVTASATFSGYNMSTAGNQTVTVSFGGQSNSYSIVVSDSGGATDTSEYSLINSTDDLEVGKSYIITNGITGTVKAIAVTSNSSNRKTTDVTVSSGKITRGSSIMSFTLGGSSGAYTFATENYEGTNGYLASASGNSNQLRVVTEVNTATIGFSGDAAVINIGPHASRTLVRYNANNGSPIFACYASGQQDVYLWKEVAAKNLTSISLNTDDVQKSFSIGEIFNYTGLVVTANYTNAPSAVVTPTNVSSPNMSTVGDKTITVTYTENAVTKTASYTISVTANPSISWTAPTINVYSGSTLSGTDVNAWAVTYNDGEGHQTVLTYSQLTVKLGGTTISIPHTWVAADDGKTLTATYNSLTTSASSAVQVTQTINTVTMQSEASEHVSNLTFTSSCGGSGTADDGKSWTVTSDGTESTYDSTKGIHYGTSSAAVQYILLSSSSFTSGTITKVVVNASVASGVSNTTVAVRIGGNQFGGTARTLTTTATEYEFSDSITAGTIEVEILKPQQATKAIYCKSIVVTYTTPGSSTTISNSLDHIAAQRAAVKFAKAFNAAMDTTASCTTNMSSAWSSCSSAYSTFLSEAAALGSAEETYAKNLVKYATAQYSDDSGEACIERMLKTYEICVQKHGQTAFMSDLITLGKVPTPNVVSTLSNNTNLVIVIVASTIMIAAIGGYFYIRRLKQK